MPRNSTVAVHVGYYHKPKDGLTPVFDSVLQKWTHRTLPTAEQMTATENHLAAVSDKAAAADQKAAQAITKADTAKEVADSKATASEAVDQARSDLFVITPLQNAGQSVTINRVRAINFVEIEKSRWQVSLDLRSSPSETPSSANTGWLNYASPEDVTFLQDQIDALEKRIAALEKLMTAK